MRIVELILNESEENVGIDAVSVVENPAIEENWIALKKHEIKLKTINKEKRILMGPALVPKKQIFRRNEETDEEYYIYFSEQTIRKASQLFLKNSNQNNATIEHTEKINGMSVVESWIVEDPTKDKSALYKFNVPQGTWMISMKVDNDEIWNKVQEGEIKGFSIEGYFAEKVEASKQELKSTVIDNDFAIIDDRTAYSTKEKAMQVAKEIGCKGFHTHDFEGRTWYMPCETHDKEELESFADYPDAVKNNAKRGIELNEKNGNKCATPIGRRRATTLARGGNVTEETIKRMYSYLSRAKTYYEDADTNDCGNISYLLWGGLAGLRWSESKLKQLEKLEETIEERDQEILSEIKQIFEDAKK